MEDETPTTCAWCFYGVCAEHAVVQSLIEVVEEGSTVEEDEHDDSD